jgi:ring-1,2-phenylacetyl-CoA epoxidase subunit PaaB
MTGPDDGTAAGRPDAAGSGAAAPGATGPAQPTGYTAEGGHGAVPTAGVPVEPDRPPARHSWPLFEVFVRGKRGLNHVHVGSLRAADERMALQNARDVYTRRNEGVSIWVVRSDLITASSPAEKDPFFAPSGDKVYRHPTFYALPDDVPHM